MEPTVVLVIPTNEPANMTKGKCVDFVKWPSTAPTKPTTQEATTIDNPYIYSPINNLPLTILIILLAICTPYTIISKNKVLLKPSLIPNYLYIILFTSILGYYYILHEKFQEHNVLLLGSLVIPMIGHFLNNSWLELRALWLCMIGIFEIIDIRHYGY